MKIKSVLVDATRLVHDGERTEREEGDDTKYGVNIAIA